LSQFKLKDEKVKDFIYDEEDKENESPSFNKLFGNFDQLTINDYFPGDGIPPHTDSHSPFEDVKTYIFNF
jgi:hypothetical protein